MAKGKSEQDKRLQKTVSDLISKALELTGKIRSSSIEDLHEDYLA